MEEQTDQSYNVPMVFYYDQGEDKLTSNLKVSGIPGWIQAYAREEHKIEMRPIMTNVYFSRTAFSEPTPYLQIMMLREA